MPRSDAAKLPNPYTVVLNPRKAEPIKAEPFGGKGDHDGNGKVGGAKKPAKK